MLAWGRLRGHRKILIACGRVSCEGSKHFVSIGAPVRAAKNINFGRVRKNKNKLVGGRPEVGARGKIKIVQAHKETKWFGRARKQNGLGPQEK